LKIRIDEVKKKRVDLSEEVPATHYPSLTELEEVGECNFVAPVATELSAVWEYDHVRVTGKVTTAAKLTCSRCLAEYDLPVDSEFTIFYTEASRDGIDDEEVELSDEDLISVSYQGDEIDVDFEIAEQVMMELPFKPLCDEDCKGLCTECGADLNLGDCGCDRSSVNLKMSALKNLSIDK